MQSDLMSERAETCHWIAPHEYVAAGLRYLQLAGLLTGCVLLCACQSIPEPKAFSSLPTVGEMLKQRPHAEQPDPKQQRWTNPAQVASKDYYVPGQPLKTQSEVQQAGYFPEGSPYAAGWGHHFVGPGGMLPQTGPMPVPFGASGPECHWQGDPAAINNPEAIPGDQPWGPPGIARPWPYDEYIADGGDNELRVQVEKDFTVHGLQEEDTVVHYDTLDGRTLVCESNKVCIYAPRFASVRQVTSSVQNDGWDNINGWNHDLKLNLHKEQLAANTKVKQLQPLGDVGTKGPTALLDKLPPLSVDNLQRLTVFEGALKPFEDFQIIRTGELLNSEGPRLAQAIIAAQTWTIKQGPQAIVDKAEIISQDHFSKVQETKLTEEPPARPKMCITKIASQKDALPGEVIEFTLRFDNVGNQVIGNVTILDSLTPRLAYVEGSAQCSVGAKFYTQENAGESLILRWEITEPVEKGAGGIIRFKCRVR